jgi:lipopolysaccharide/colanic/teichoic acid biosynthesis glycosyltransferase
LMRTEHMIAGTLGDNGTADAIGLEAYNALLRSPTAQRKRNDQPVRPTPVADRSATDEDPTVLGLAADLARRTASRYERLAKPLIDWMAAAALVLLLSPALLMIYIAVLLAVGRPAIFRQERVGRNGQSFSMLKFRTMRADRRVSSGPYEGPERRMTHKSPDDPRHTRLGRLLRKTSLDELPQLINVVKGQMSLVGPRPELVEIAERYAPWQQVRHVVKPGVTGLWQTTERGNGRLLHECVDLDLHYISALSFRHDVAILARTPVALLRNKGVI